MYEVEFMVETEEETPIVIAWISFTKSPPNFFGKEYVFYLASAVGRPLHVDMATQNETRPICVKVKVEVNLLVDFLRESKLLK